MHDSLPAGNACTGGFADIRRDHCIDVADHGTVLAFVVDPLADDLANVHGAFLSKTRVWLNGWGRPNTGKGGPVGLAFPTAGARLIRVLDVAAVLGVILWVARKEKSPELG